MMYTTQKAFTLVETLVAVTVLSLAIVGPFSAIQSAINGSYASRDELTATMLAQEAIEYVIAVRDNNYLYNRAHNTGQRSWLDGLDDVANEGCFDLDPNDSVAHSCSVDLKTYSVSSCGTDTCSPLSIEESTYIYTKATGSGYTPSRFTRSLTIEQVDQATNPDKEVKAVVTVTWSSGHRNFSVRLEEHIFNWL